MAAVGTVGAVVALAVAGATEPAPRPAVLQPAGPRWPLDRPGRELSATFMEPRGGRYHAGIDVRTGGVVGTPVVAPRAGWIARLRTSPTGYGKAVYLQTQDDTTYVFAHLAAFADRLQERVVPEQRRSGRYEQDLTLPARSLPVAAGELLALSGDTGSGAPHLHFEVRGPDEVPVNPLLHGFTVPDVIAPRIRRLRLLALSATARLQGGVRPAELAPGDTVHAYGRLGVQVDVRDHTTVSSQPLMPLGVEARLDGTRVFRLQQHACPFPLTAQARLELQPEERRLWMRLYAREGDTLPAREARHPGATCELPADGALHRLTVRAWDAAGHADSATVWLRARGPAGAAAPAPAGFAGAAAWRMELTPREGLLEVRAVPVATPTATVPAAVAAMGAAGAGLRVQCGDAAAIDLAPTVERGAGALVGAVEWARLRTGPLRATLHAPGAQTPLAQVERLFAVGGPGGWTLRESRSGWELSDSTRTGVSAPGGALWLAAAPARLGLPPGARLVGEAAAVEGAGAALLSAVRLGLRADRLEGLHDPHVGLYARDAEGEWSWLGARRGRDPHDGAPVLSAPLDAPAVVAALIDAEPPVLRRFEVNGTPLAAAVASVPPRRQRTWRGVTLARWPAVVLPVTDACAGLDGDGIAVTLDGRPYPARWDPEAQRLYVEFDADPGSGEHDIAVTVTDRAGNRSRAQQRVRLQSTR